MLFDLRAAGRRRTVKAVYLTLALLMGGGLVFFGIGSDVQGGLFDALKEDSGSLSEDSFKDRADKQEKFVRAHPTDAAAWAELARRRFQAAEVDEQGNPTAEGRKQLQRADRAWQRHVTLAKSKADLNVAAIMVQAYVGLNQLDKAVRAQELIVEAADEPTAAQYVQLAVYAYSAGQTRKGDLAGDKALDLAPKDDREQIKGQLEAAKSQGAQQQTQQPAGAG